MTRIQIRDYLFTFGKYKSHSAECVWICYSSDEEDLKISKKCEGCNYS